MVLYKDASPGRKLRNGQIKEAVQASINADIINIKDADIEMDEYGEEEHRGASSQARRVLAGEELASSSMNPLVGRYGSTQSMMRKSSQAKPS